MLNLQETIAINDLEQAISGAKFIGCDCNGKDCTTCRFHYTSNDGGFSYSCSIEKMERLLNDIKDNMEENNASEKMNKNIYHWQIDDQVYFLDRANNIGEFPCIFKGIVEEIKRDSIRVKISFNQSTNLVWVRVENCFNTLEKLKEAFLQHIEKEIYIINNPDKVSR